MISNQTHQINRYLVVIMNGNKNPYKSMVAKDITESIIKEKSGKDTHAVYWEKDEQAARLSAAFQRWSEKDVWSAAAPKVSSSDISLLDGWNIS